MPQPGSRSFIDDARRWILGPVVLVLVLNVGFLLVQLVAARLPAEPLRTRVRAGFQAGTLSSQDRLPWDSASGWDQWSDCVLLQMVVFRGDSAVADALGPPIFPRLPTRTRRPQCSLLRLAVEGQMPRSCPFQVQVDDPECGVLRYDYTRYWHGNRALASVLLLSLDVEEIRAAYKLASYVALALLCAAIVFKARDVWLALLPVPLLGMTSSGMPYYGQSLMHAPAFLVILGALVLLTWARGRFGDGRSLIVFAAAVGAICTFLEFWVGAIPVGASLLFYWVYFLQRGPGGEARSPRPFLLPLACAATFVAASALTILLKLGFASFVFDGRGVVRAFVRQLGKRIGGVDHTPGGVFQAMVEHHGLLGSGSSRAALILVSVSALGWLGGIALIVADALRNRSLGSSLSANRDVVAAFVAASIVLGWLAFFRDHSSVHAFFMVRTLFVPLALGFATLFLACVRPIRWWAARRREKVRGGSVRLGAHRRAS